MSYGHPPPGQQYPGQQFSGYPPPRSPQPNVSYNMPPVQNQHQNQFQPPHQGYGTPPPPPNQGGWGQVLSTQSQFGDMNRPTPPGQFLPPQQQWQQGPPQQAFGGPPPFQQHPYPPQHQQHLPPPQQGFPPQQQQGLPSLPSPGYDPRAQVQGDARNDAQALRSAMKGFGTDERALIAILTKPDPLQMALLRNTYNQQFRGRDLEKDIASETSSYFREGLLALVRGPLLQDVRNVNKAIKGLGTKEILLNDVLLGRSNADMRAIKQSYQATFGKTMESDVKGDLSLKTEQLFDLVMAATRAEESTPINPQQVDADVVQLHGAMGARMGTDQITVCSILSQRSDGQIRAIAQGFQQRFSKSLEDTVRGEFSGHMEDALLLIVRRATDRTMTDALQLEESMAGLGTKDDLLVNRIVRVHWNRTHIDQVKRAYQLRFKRDLISRVKGETRGDYEKLMVACLS